MFRNRIKKMFENKRVPSSRFKKIVSSSIEIKMIPIHDISEYDENNEPADTLNDIDNDDTFEDELFGNNSFDSEWTDFFIDSEDFFIDSELRKPVNL